MLSVVFPLSLMAADTGLAVLHSQGGVWIDGSEAPNTIVVTAGDLIETKPGAIANLDVDGSSVLIQAESVVKFNGDSLTLEHGSVSVGTSKLMSVHVDCLRVVPVSNDWTQYDVTNVNATVQVSARKNDVNIDRGASLRKSPPESAASPSATVHEGQEATRDATVACGGATRPGGATSGVNTKWIEIGAGAGGGILLCLLLCKGTSNKNISPSQP
jgi:hypothetical protein